jgi:hypothetical protein
VQLAGRLGHAEVDQAGDAVAAHEHVLGRDVAVDDAQRPAALVGGLVGRVQPCRIPQPMADDDRQRQRPAIVQRPAQELGQRDARHVVHHQEQLPVGLDHVARPRPRWGGARAPPAGPRRGAW